MISRIKGLIASSMQLGTNNTASPAMAGDVAYWDGSKVKTTPLSSWSTELGTPVGVVVVPTGFAPDGKARIVSLKCVDASGNTSTSTVHMCWKVYGTDTTIDTTLTNYTRVPITNNTGSVSSSSNSSGYLPSDNFTGDTSFVDGSAKYNTTDTNKIPSPYNGNEFNTDYSKYISGNNVLSDFNGLSNTQVLVGIGSGYVAANAAWNYDDGVSNTQWYLPSAGELGFLIARFKAINNTISMLSGVAVPSDIFWSSTECSRYNVFYLYADDGSVYFSNKANSSSVRPFALLDNRAGSNIITFTIDGEQYQAEEGMTWEEWVNSNYSRGEFIMEGKNIVGKNYYSHILNVLSSDVIISNYAYINEYTGAGSGGGSGGSDN